MTEGARRSVWRAAEPPVRRCLWHPGGFASSPADGGDRVEIAPSFGFGGCECRVRACIRFSRRHRADDTEGWRRSATLPPEVGIYLYLNMTRSTTGLVAKPKKKIAAVQTRLMRLPLQIVHCRAETALRVPADCLGPGGSPRMNTAFRSLAPSRGPQDLFPAT